MVASIGKIGSPAQGVGYFEKDGYYARDDGAHREASAWAGKGAEALGLEGPVDPEAFRRVLEGEVPGGRRLGRKEIDGSIKHRPGRDVTLSAPKSVSVMALVGGDERIVGGARQGGGGDAGLDREERHRDPDARPRHGDDGPGPGDQKMVAATFRHDTSRNLDPQLHTHAVVANMVQGGDGKWRTMVDDGLFNGKMAIGAIYRAELAAGLRDLGYGIERTHADGRFEIEGVSREVIDAYSTRRAEIKAAMSERGMGDSKDNPHLAAKAALLTRAAKRDIDRDALERGWKRQAKGLGFSAAKVRAHARKAERGLAGPDLFAGPGYAAGDAAAWAVGHLAERQTVFGHADLLAATPGARAGRGDGRGGGARDYGARTRRLPPCRAGPRPWPALVDGRGAGPRFRDHRADAHRPGGGEDGDAPVGGGDEAASGTPQRGPEGSRQGHPRRHGSRPGHPGLRRHRQDDDAEAAACARREPGLPHRRPCALGLGGEDAGQRVRHPVGDPATLPRAPCGIAHGRGTADGLRKLRAANAKTMLVVDESSLASSRQAPTAGWSSRRRAPTRALRTRPSPTTCPRAPTTTERAPTRCRWRRSCRSGSRPPPNDTPRGSPPGAAESAPPIRTWWRARDVGRHPGEPLRARSASRARRGPRRATRATSRSEGMPRVWRGCFRWTGQGAFDFEIVDYHGSHP